MSVWPQGHEAQAGLLVQKPVYAVIVCEAHAAIKGSITGTSTQILTEVPENFSTRTSRTCMLFDNDSFEFCNVVEWEEDQTASSDRVTVTRGLYGPSPQARADATSIASIEEIYTTGSLSGVGGLFYRDGWASFPSGGGVSFDRQTGRTKYESVDVEILDTDNAVTGILEGSTIIGKTVIILGGYGGLNIQHMSPLFVGRITRTLATGGSYVFTLETPEKRLAQKLFQHVADASLNISPGINTTATSLNFVDATDMPGGGADAYLDHQTGVDGSAAANPTYAAYHLLIGSEIVRCEHRSGGATTIARATLGTTAATHSDTAEATLLWVVEDNPIDILLGFLLTRSWNKRSALVTDGTYKYAWVSANDEIGDVGCGFMHTEVDIESFETIRDDWFPSDIHRVVIDGTENMKSFIEDNLLRPLNLNLYVNRAGRLALALDTPALGGDTVTLTEDDIIGVPDVDFDNSEIVNRITFRFDKQVAATDYSTTNILLDATSQTEYNTDQELEIKSRGTHSDHGGVARAAAYSRSKIRSFKDPNPTLILPVLFNKIAVEPGSNVSVTHSGIPDVRAGKRGITGKRMQVVGKRPDWDRGALELTVIDSGFYRRYGLIAPTGTADYPSATSDVRGKYCFISDTTTEKMSNGDRGYRIA